jgi:hypothetical protein
MQVTIQTFGLFDCDKMATNENRFGSTFLLDYKQLSRLIDISASAAILLAPEASILNR